MITIENLADKVDRHLSQRDELTSTSECMNGISIPTIGINYQKLQNAARVDLLNRLNGLFDKDLGPLVRQTLLAGALALKHAAPGLVTHLDNISKFSGAVNAETAENFLRCVNEEFASIPESTMITEAISNLLAFGLSYAGLFQARVRTQVNQLLYAQVTIAYPACPKERRLTQQEMLDLYKCRIAEAVNTMVAQVSGRIVAFLESDDAMAEPVRAAYAELENFADRLLYGIDPITSQSAHEAWRCIFHAFPFDIGPSPSPQDQERENIRQFNGLIRGLKVDLLAWQERNGAAN